MDICSKLQTGWSSEYAMQPITTAERKVVIEIQALKKEAADEIKSLRSWIKEEGLRSNTCTKNILGKICENCQCGKAA